MMIAYYSKCQVFAKANKMTINVQGYEMHIDVCWQ